MENISGMENATAAGLLIDYLVEGTRPEGNAGCTGCVRGKAIGNKVSGLGTPLVLGGAGIVLFCVVNTVTNTVT